MPLCDGHSLHLFILLPAVLIMYKFQLSNSLSSHYLYGYITNSQNEQLPVGLTAQLVEHCSGIAEVMRWNAVKLEKIQANFLRLSKLRT